MKTFPITDDRGKQSGFEIETAYINTNKIVDLLSTIPDVNNIKHRRLFEMNNENHVQFDYSGCTCVVWEPYGDNSRYWVGPKDEQECKIDISVIENVFINYKPPFYVKLLGDLVTLKFSNFLK